MHGTVPRLHPMDMGELFQATVTLYRENFTLFAGIVAFIAIPETLIAFGLSAFASGVFLSALVSLLALVLGLLSEGALALAVSRRYLGRAVSIEGAYASIGSATFFSLAVASLIYGFAVALGLFFFVIPGVYLAIRFLFVPQAIVIERRPVGDSFRRSAELVAGMWWRVFGIAIAVFISIAVLQTIGSGVATSIQAGGVTDRAVGLIISAAVSILVVPVELVAFTLLYYDMRIRKEGFDLRVLARDIDDGTLG
ncbi:MAG: hypothetical protein PVSMB7_02020 [Chloroflexota bacterium]